MTRVKDMTPAERALRVLHLGYVNDVPVWVLGQTRKRADGNYSVNRVAGDELVDRELARRSRPRGMFLLLTAKGKERLGLAA